MGYGILKAVRFLPWLKDMERFYWGDLDTNGLRILSKLRQERKGEMRIAL
ncbi:Wadjet anti-phage system protein JetD domain-containing protein [Mitsuokella sp. oral taxon 131]|nr:hypothetical protein HMPREF1985_00413 [Mitsuokella sp. oral taxon 131 str. W9106]